MTSALPRLALVAALAGAIVWAVFNRQALDAAAMEAALQQLGAWAPAAFVALWAIWALSFLPGAVLGIAGGALFGPVLGTLWNLAGATLGATLAFLAARYVASDWVARKAGSRLKRLLDGVEAEGWRFVAFTRLVPLFPFNLLNYALGITRIKVLPYIAATLLCMVPGTMAYSYLGYAGREAITGGEALIQKGLLALGLLAVLAFLPRLVKRFRNRRIIGVSDLESKLNAGDDILVLDVRDSSDYAGDTGHIATAMNIPLADLPKRLRELEGFRERPLAVVCFTDKRSKTALALLRQKGFTHAMLVAGGMKEWNTMARPVER
jgi:uncharacterized membrane protein YdjX (TVP38/TMEM64 family)